MKLKNTPAVIKRNNSDGFIKEIENLTSYIAEGVIIANSKEEIIWVNKALEKISGYKLNELKGKRPSILQGPATDKNTIASIRETLDKHETVNVELVNYRPDGTQYWIRLTVSPIYDRRKNLVNYIAFEHDITEHKRKEKSLIESEKQFKNLFIKNPCVMWIFDPVTFKFEEVNEAAVNMYGYTREEFLNMTALDIRLKEDAALLKNEVKKPLDSFVQRGVWRHIKKNGEMIYMEVSTNKIEFNGKTCLLLLANDVTDKLKKENEVIKLNSELSQLNSTLQKNLFITNLLNKELKEREERLRISNEAAKIGYWERNLKDNTLFWSEKMYELFGYEPGTAEMTFTLFAGRIHPYDRTAFLEKLDNVLENRASLEVEYRIILPDGKISHIYSKGDLVLNDAGIPEKVVGISMDITNRKEAELAADEQLKRIDTILESLTDPFYVVDYNGTILLANNAATEPIGLSPGQAIGKNTWELFGMKDTSFIKNEFQKAMSRKVSTTFDYEFDGRWYAIFLYPSEIGIAVSSKDITDKKKAKQELEQQVKNINIILSSITDLFYIIDKDYNLLFANATTAKSLNKSQTEIIGKNILELSNGNAYPQMKENFDKAFSENKSQDFEVQNKGKTYRVYLYPSEIGLTVTARDITVRKNQEEEIKRNSKFLKEISDSMPGFVFQSEYDANYNMKLNFAGKNAEKYWGYTPQDVISGKRGFMDCVHCEDRERIMNTRLESVKNLIPMDFKLRYVNILTKETKWARIFAVPSRLENGNTIVNGTAIDITDTEKYYNELEDANRRYEYLSKATHETIWEMDIETYNVSLGGAYKELFGRKEGDNVMSFEEWQSFVHPDDFEKIVSSMEKVMSDPNNKCWEGGYRIIRKDGEMLEVFERSYMVYDENNKLVKVIGTTQDVTELKKVEAERDKIIEDLVRRNEALEQFTYIVSHNLRAPVANIMGITEFLDDKAEDKESKEEMYGLMKQSVANLDFVIKDMNSILNAKRNLSEKKNEIHFSSVVEDIKDSIARSIEDEGAKIICDFSGKKSFYAVKSYLYSIFYNLICNSIKFRNSESPVIKIKSHEDDEWVYLDFEDNGIGIDLSKFGDKIFGLYKKFHPEKEGKGMGLFMAKTQVENLNGFISVQSKVNRGTIFNIKLKK